jgi:hypothetical protein
MAENIDALKKEIDSLKSEIAKTPKPASNPIAVDSKPFEDKIKQLEADKSRFESDAKVFQKKYEEEIARQTKVAIDSMHTDWGIDAKAFDGKSKEYIDGAMMAFDFANKMPESSIKGKTDVSADSTKVEMDSVNNYIYNAATGKMEPKKVK